MGKYLVPFVWYGGKARWLDWLLPKLDVPHSIYVEPFGGAASVLLNKKPVGLMVYNDINSNLTTFFRILRDRTEEFISRAVLIPYSREEFYKAREIVRSGVAKDDMEQALAFWVVASQSYAGISTNTHQAWGYVLSNIPRRIHSEIGKLLRRYDDLIEIAERLLFVQIDNLPATEVIRRYDSPDTLFYCDPPYPPESRSSDSNDAYGDNEMSTEEHIELAKLLHEVEAKVALSGYECDLLDDLYSDWNKWLAKKIKYRLNHNADPIVRREVLWTNYDITVHSLPLFKATAQSK